MKLTKIAFGVAIAAGAIGQASASELLFPYVVSGGNVTTVISVINTATVGFDGTDSRYIRMAVNHKLPNEAGVVNNAATCAHVDGVIGSSVNDLTSIDLGGRLGAGALFNDTLGAQSDENGTYTFLNNVANIPAFRGYVSMWNIVDPTITGIERDEVENRVVGTTLQGDALVIDFNTGASWGYRALNRAAIDDSGDDFADALADWDEDLSNAIWNLNPYNPGTGEFGVNIPFMPLDEVTTRFFVTALNDGELNQLNGLPGAVQVSFGGGSASTLFDREENGDSLNTSQRVECFGVVDLVDMLGAAANFNNYREQGGFAPLSVSEPTSGDEADSAHVIKLEFGTTDINGTNVGGTWNNGYVLQNRNN